ncbi:MAG: TrmH family RNA methyltransferase [Hylemonella sp.]
MSTQPQRISSRDNPLLKELRRLSHDATAYRRLGRIWVEGDHLCRAARARGWRAALAVFSESFWSKSVDGLEDGAIKTVVISDALFAGISALESSVGVGYVLEPPAAAALRAGVPTVVLDRLQDAGNVGSILRSAAAFGFAQVAALKGTAALWAPKVLRAGMGAHFGLHLVEGLEPAALDALALPLLATSSHEGALLHRQRLPWPCAWVFGHEGQGVAEALMASAALKVRIAQPGGEESLNVAAAAAICLHASAVAAAG